jgi:hypothetical protein
MTDLKALAGKLTEAQRDIEGDIRIAIWNAGMNGGMGQDLTQTFIRRAMADPCMVRALASIADLEACRSGDGNQCFVAENGHKQPAGRAEEISPEAPQEGWREALERIANGEAFRCQRFAEDDDAEYFLRAQRNVQQVARTALSPKGEGVTDEPKGEGDHGPRG